MHFYMFYRQIMPEKLMYNQEALFRDIVGGGGGGGGRTGS